MSNFSICYQIWQFLPKLGIIYQIWHILPNFATIERVVGKNVQISANFANCVVKFFKILTKNVKIWQNLSKLENFVVKIFKSCDSDWLTLVDKNDYLFLKVRETEKITSGKCALKRIFEQNQKWL